MPALLLRFPRSGVADTVGALVAQDGTGAQAHPGSAALRHGLGATRNLADALHYLCLLHGRQPDIVDLASFRHPATSAGVFLTGAARAFAVERTFLARLAVAAGPQPSTPGSADSENVVKGQAHALSMLAGSDRHGTAFGAAVALLIDWHDVRGVLDCAAERFGIASPETRLPSVQECVAAAGALGAQGGTERAIAFGAQQFLAQQRGLWSLLEARAIARGDA